MWKDLTMSQKNDVIQMAVQSGIHNIKDIASFYDNSVSQRPLDSNNKYVNGGNLFLTGGPKSAYTSSDSIRKQIATWEGSSMYKPAPDTHKVNRSFELEERDFIRQIPEEIRSRMSQEELDALFSLSYNIGAGNFRRRVVPNLINLYNGRGSVEDVVNSMYGTKDKLYRGLQKRRAVERQLFKNAFLNKNFETFENFSDSDEEFNSEEPDFEAMFPTLSQDEITEILSLPKEEIIRKMKNQAEIEADITSNLARPTIASLLNINNDEYFAEGGQMNNENEPISKDYLKWKKKASKYKGLDIDKDNTYDYLGWYNNNPKNAWNFLKKDKEAHFEDDYKTVYHPTFSKESKYSGRVHPIFNPQGLGGGDFSTDGKTFTMSPDGYVGPVSMDDRIDYIENAEKNGLTLREADGSLPIYNGERWGGVLPQITIYGKKPYAGGGVF